MESFFISGRLVDNFKGLPLKDTINCAKRALKPLRYWRTRRL